MPKVIFLSAVAASFYTWNTGMLGDVWTPLNSFVAPCALSAVGWLAGSKGWRGLREHFQDKHLASRLFSELNVTDESDFLSNLPDLEIFVTGLGEQRKENIFAKVDKLIKAIPVNATRDTVFGHFNKLVHPADILPKINLIAAAQPREERPSAVLEIAGANLVKWVATNPKLALFVFRYEFPSPKKLFGYVGNHLLQYQRVPSALDKSEITALTNLIRWAIEVCTFTPDNQEKGESLKTQALRILPKLADKTVLNRGQIKSFHRVFNNLAAICLEKEEDNPDKYIELTGDDIKAIRDIVLKKDKPNANYTAQEKDELKNALDEAESRLPKDSGSAGGAGAEGDGQASKTARARGKK